MKKILLFLLIIPFIGFAQSKFVCNKEGISPRFIVKEIDSLNKEKLIKKTINWIKEYFENPDYVLKSVIDNDKVRFIGSDPLGYKYNVLGKPVGVPINYTIEISFKKGKYRFKIIELTFTNKFAQPITEINLLTTNYLGYYKKNGKIRPKFKNTFNSISYSLNKVLYSLHNYLDSKGSNTDDEDW